MPEKKILNEDLFYKGSSANLPRLHTSENKVPFVDFKEFAVTHITVFLRSFNYEKIKGDLRILAVIYIALKNHLLLFIRKTQELIINVLPFYVLSIINNKL